MRYLLFTLFFLYHASYACEVIDDTGRHIQLNHPAKRIISLAPDLTEDLFAIGAGEKLIGVMRGSDYPAQAKTIPIIATYDYLDREALLILQPDLVVAWTDTRFAEQLKKLHIPVYWSRPKRLMDVPLTLRRLGCLVGTEKKAELIAADFMQRHQKLLTKYAEKPPVTVFFQVWPNPLITITKNSWIHEAISLCGGINIFTDLKGTAPEVSLEAVLLANPEVIIGTENNPHWQAYWQKWNKMRAVKNQHLFSVAADRIERASPRLLEGTEDLCNAIDIARHRR